MKIRSTANQLRRLVLVPAVLVAVALGSASSAQALYSHSYRFNTAVSCDGNTIKTVGNIDHYNAQIPRASGIKVTQENGTTNSSTTKVFLRGPSGNDTSTKSVSNGTSASWTGVIAAVYSVKPYRSAAANCNGSLPGHGNYTWSSTFLVGVE